MRDRTDEQNAVANRDEEEAVDQFHASIRNLGAIAGIRHDTTDHCRDGLAAALDMVACECGLNASVPLDRIDEATDEDRIRRYALMNGWRLRKVKLSGRLTERESGTLIAFDRETGEPAVLILRGNRNEIYRPSDGTRCLLTRSDTKKLAGHALYFYEQLPDRPVTVRELFSFLAKGSLPQFRTLFIAGIIGGLFALLFPIVVRYVTAEIIPSANLPELKQLMGLLIVLTVGSVLFGVVPKLMLISLGTSRFERFESALCDRILKSPLPFFKEYNVGDLTQRILSATRIQDAFLSVVSNQALSSVFSLCSLLMLFYFSAKLAVIGVMFAIVYALIMFLLYRRNLVPLRQGAEATGRSTGLLKQFIDGIAKIRVAGAETRITTKYVEAFAESVKADYAINKNSSFMQAVACVYPAAVSSVFFAVIILAIPGEISLPQFLGFMSAYASFQLGMTGLAEDIWSLLAVKPEIERIKPLLEVQPEQTAGKQHPGRLDGRIEFTDVTFGYDPQLPPVLQGVNLTADKGEFIAIVGPSGAGKSTLVRLLLGFETPDSGGIYYSGYDLANLDLRAVRSQLGIVLQNSRLIHGSILDNVIGGTDYTMDDAMSALELASLSDDIKAMPMGVHTVVNDQLVSGGQRQRILLARALVGNPPAVILDESTSALDNVTQQEISGNMDHLKFTRIVIAHRLSTIRNANRIYVLEDGKVTQSGTYEELLAVEGTFRHLALRQLVETN